jgi:hypothetical protein
MTNKLVIIAHVMRCKVKSNMEILQTFQFPQAEILVR